jgi:predicted nucleic acid-binding protein
MKIVFDTNVLLSALIPTGKPQELFTTAVNGQIELLLSKK